MKPSPTENRDREVSPTEAHRERGHLSYGDASRPGGLSDRQFPIFSPQRGGCQRDVERFMKHRQNNLVFLRIGLILVALGQLVHRDFSLQTKNVRGPRAKDVLLSIMDSLMLKEGINVFIPEPGQRGRHSSPTEQIPLARVVQRRVPISFVPHHQRER